MGRVIDLDAYRVSRRIRTVEELERRRVRPTIEEVKAADRRRERKPWSLAEDDALRKLWSSSRAYPEIAREMRINFGRSLDECLSRVGVLVGVDREGVPYLDNPIDRALLVLNGRASIDVDAPGGFRIGDRPANAADVIRAANRSLRRRNRPLIPAGDCVS